MSVKSFFKMFATHYFVIYGLTMLVTLVWCGLFNRNAEIGLDYLCQAALFALVADAPLAVFISNSELSQKQMWIRIIVHGVILECVLVPIGYFIGMWGGVGGGFAFFFSVLAVDVIMHLLQYLNKRTISDRINKQLKSRREEQYELDVRAEKENDGQQQ